MEKISIQRAFMTGMHIYLAGAEETLLKSMQCSFRFRDAINYALDHGVTEEDIQALFDEVNREKILEEASRN